MKHWFDSEDWNTETNVQDGHILKWNSTGSQIHIK